MFKQCTDYGQYGVYSLQQGVRKALLFTDNSAQNYIYFVLNKGKTTTGIINDESPYISVITLVSKPIVIAH